jgi:hypothetical protein
MEENNNATVVDQHAKAGRPTKYEPETIDRLLAALAAGLTHKQACIAAAIGQSTLADWRDRYPDLQERMDKAREAARLKGLQAIQAAGEKDWRAHAKWLELCFPEYRKPDTRVEVNANAQAGDVRVVCDEATRKALIAARERFLTERPTSSSQPAQPKLESGGIGATHVPEDPEIALMKSLECGITYEQAVCGADRLGRFGNTD